MPSLEQTQNKQEKNVYNSVLAASPTKMQATLTGNTGGNNSNQLGQDIDLSKISPELAAKIVKYFVLPMFENAPRNKHRKGDGRQQTSIAQAGTIYSELKLSEQLTETLGQVRSQVTRLTNSLE